MCSIKPYKFRTKVLITGTVLLVFAAALAGFLIGSADKNRRTFEPPDPYEAPKPSASILHVFEKAAVCTDAPACSEIGKSILLQNGSAVDAAIAAMFCNGFHNQASMGIGGGFFMTVYIKAEEKAYSLIAREKAPQAATYDMFHGNADKLSKGPLAVAVPGEVRGMWTAHKRWGKLPWASLIQPTLKFCETGYNLSKPSYDGLEIAPYVKNDLHLRKQYYDTSRGKFFKPGALVKPSEALCSTLTKIAERGGDDFYNGSLAAELIEDLKDVQSIITAEDLSKYEAVIKDPISVPIGNGDILYTPPPPGSGVILADILNILSGYNFTAASINTTEDIILTYHRIIEAFKFAYGLRTRLGDADMLNLTDILRSSTLIANVTDPTYGVEIRSRIDDFKTSNDTAYYGVDQSIALDSGTAHISIIAENGDAVSITSSINYYFGAGFTTKRTGIVMNNVMDDFSNPGVTNYFGLKPAPANFIAPGKRPMSSMTPSIIVDSAGNAKMVIGASGGTKITTSVALTIMRKLWFEQTVKEAVDAPRIHHQIFPMHTEYEYGVTKDVLNGLRAKGHGTKRYKGRGSVVCALFRNSTAIYANADFRKGGDVAGH